MSNTINPTQGYTDTGYDSTIGETSFPKESRNIGAGAVLDPASEENDGFVVAGDNPVLEEPIQSWDAADCGGCAIASFGSAYMTLITELSAEQRRQTRDLKAMETEQLVASIKDQADKLRTKAVLDLVGGIVSGGLSIASGAFTAGAVSRGMKTPKFGDSPKAMKAQALAVTSKAQGWSSAINSLGTLVNSGFGYGSTATEAASKELEAEIERTRAMQDSLDMQAEALMALIQKAISTQDAIQQNMNQTRQRILG